MGKTLLLGVSIDLLTVKLGVLLMPFIIQWRCKEGETCVLLDDLNIDLLKSELPSTNDFFKLLYSTYF